MFKTQFQSLMMSLIVDSKTSDARLRPMARTLYTYTPQGVSMAVSFLLSSCHGNWKNPLLASTTLQTLACNSSINMYETSSSV